jgi:hypothetical protein
MLLLSLARSLFPPSQTYLNRLRQKAIEEHDRAKRFFASGKKDWAAMALKRAKIIEAEVAASLE